MDVSPMAPELGTFRSGRARAVRYVAEFSRTVRFAPFRHKPSCRRFTAWIAARLTKPAERSRDKPADVFADCCRTKCVPRSSAGHTLSLCTFPRRHEFATSQDGLRLFLQRFTPANGREERFLKRLGVLYLKLNTSDCGRSEMSVRPNRSRNF